MNKSLTKLISLWFEFSQLLSKTYFSKHLVFVTKRALACIMALKFCFNRTGVKKMVGFFPPNRTRGLREDKSLSPNNCYLFESEFRQLLYRYSVKTIFFSSKSECNIICMPLFNHTIGTYGGLIFFPKLPKRSW